MIGPGDIERLLKAQNPQWIAQIPESEANANYAIKEVSRVATIESVIGASSGKRFYIFVVEPPDDESYRVTSFSQTEATPIGIHRSSESRRIEKGIYTVKTVLLKGSVVKVFAGHTDSREYGEMYLEVDPSSPETVVHHLEKESFLISGNMRTIERTEFQNYGIRSSDSRYKTLLLYQKTMKG